MQADNIRITVNGHSHQIPARQSIASLLQLLDVAADRVAVELNHSIVRKRDWSETTIPSDSQIEIVEFVGGG